MNSICTAAVCISPRYLFTIATIHSEQYWIQKWHILQLFGLGHICHRTWFLRFFTWQDSVWIHSDFYARFTAVFLLNISTAFYPFLQRQGGFLIKVFSILKEDLLYHINCPKIKLHFQIFFQTNPACIIYVPMFKLFMHDISIYEFSKSRIIKISRYVVSRIFSKF